MKVSIVTPVLNNKETIHDCIDSVSRQSYDHIEHVIIDGGSTDGTVDIIKKNQDRLLMWVSEPDRGIYDAMNKGINKTSGDIIGVLNSDDMYTDNRVIEKVAELLLGMDAETCYGDLMYVDRANINKTVRYWKSGCYRRGNFRRGWMPPHPTFFVRRSVYEKHGLFNLDFTLAADYELMLRFLYKHSISTVYIPEVLVKMRIGGSCRPGVQNTLHNMAENYRAWRVNGLKVNPLTFLLKPLSKTLQYKKP